MLSLSLLVVTVLAGILWLTYFEERRNRSRPSLKVEEIWTGTERRVEKRFSKVVPVLYSHPKTSRNRSSRSQNVSAGGMQLVLPEKLSPGTELELEFSLSEGQQPFRVIGRVVWMSEIPPEGGQRLFRTGLHFVQIDEKESERLRQFLYEGKMIDNDSS